MRRSAHSALRQRIRATIALTGLLGPSLPDGPATPSHRGSACPPPGRQRRSTKTAQLAESTGASAVLRFGWRRVVR